MPVRGDFTALRRLAAALADIASDDAQRALADDLGAVALREIAAGFQTARDPTGKPWAPDRILRGPVLRRTGRLMASFTARRFGSGVLVTSAVGYGIFHQDGTRHLPRRAIVPSPQLGDLGPWRRVFVAATRTWFWSGFAR